jgi:2-haloacid dehalogenase
MRLTDFEALSFDCYGTLIDWEAGIGAVLARWAREQGLSVSAEELLEEYARAEARQEEQTPEALYPEILGAAMRSLGASLGVDVTAEQSERLAMSVADWPAFPDSTGALAALSSRYKLVILSNVDRRSFANSNARLGVRFAAVITAQDAGSYKPSLRNFEILVKTVRGLGVAQGRLLHVAQSLFHDHVPARSLGLPTVWIDRRGEHAGWGATPPPGVVVTPRLDLPINGGVRGCVLGGGHRLSDPEPPVRSRRSTRDTFADVSPEAREVTRRPPLRSPARQQPSAPRRPTDGCPTGVC